MAAQHGRGNNKPSARRPSPRGRTAKPTPRRHVDAPSKRAEPDTSADDVVSSPAPGAEPVTDTAAGSGAAASPAPEKPGSFSSTRVSTSKGAATKVDDAVPTEPPGRWPTLIRPWLGTVVRIALGIIFLVAAAEKVGTPRTFLQATRAYDILPDVLAKGVAYGLPFLEITVGALLILGIATRIAALATGVLLIVFLIGIIQASVRGLRIECGCFGGGGALSAGQSTSYTWEILRDFGMLVMAAYLVIWPVTKYAADDMVRASVSDPTSVRMGPRRTKEAQRRIAELAAKRRKQAATRIIAVSVAAVVVMVGVGFIGVGVQSHRAASQAKAGALVVPPIASNDGVLVGSPKAKVTVDLYEDFICPACQAFQTEDGTTIDAAIKDGSANFRFHMLNFLDDHSTPAGYSSRAAQAAACMPDSTTFKKFHDLLYEDKVQPKEGSAGLTNAQLISYGRQVGAKDPALSTCINGNRYKAWVNNITNTAEKNGISATPTVQINGKAVQSSNNSAPDPATLKKAIASGKGTGSKGNPTTIVIVAIVVVVLVIGGVFLYTGSNRRPRGGGSGGRGGGPGRPRPGPRPGGGPGAKSGRDRSQSAKSGRDRTPAVAGRSRP